MKRRDFLKVSATGAAATAVASPAIAQSSPEIKWRMTSSFPKSLDTLFGASWMFAKYVAEMTDNKFQIQLFAAGEIIPGLQALDAVSNGTVEMCHTVVLLLCRQGSDVRDLCLGAVRPQCAHAEFLVVSGRWHGARQRVLQEVRRDRPSRAAIPAPRWAAGSARRSRRVADLSGLKFRIGGIAGQVLQKVGVVPQQIAGGDIYPALEKGTIDAAEWVGPYDDEKLGFQKVAKYYYYPGFWEGGTAVHAFCNLEKWNSLPKNYQAIVANAAANANTWMAARYDMQNPSALKRLVAGGTQLRPFTNEVLEACLKATNELWAEISAKNADFKKSIDAMQAYRSDQYLWWQVAEYTFDSFMIRSRTRG